MKLLPARLTANFSQPVTCGGSIGARTCIPVAEITPSILDSWWASADTRIFDPHDVRKRRCANCSAADQSPQLQSTPGLKSCSHSTPSRQEAFVIRLASALGVAHNGLFLEVGGHDGLHASNTVFSQVCRKWRGLMIEANPNSFNLLTQHRAGVIAVRTALCATAGSVDFVTRRAQYKGSDTDEMGGVASALDTAAQDAWRRKFDDKAELRAGNVTAADPYFVHYAVPCMQLSSLLSALQVARVDIFWLDVEGSELIVLQSIDFSSISIGLLVVELRVGNAKVNVQIRSLLRQAGYELVRTMKVWASKIYDNVFLRCEHFLQGPTPHDRREMPPYALQLLQQPYAYRKRVGAIHSTYKLGRWKSAGAYVLDGVHDDCAAVPHPSEKRQWC